MNRNSVQKGLSIPCAARRGELAGRWRSRARTSVLVAIFVAAAMAGSCGAVGGFGGTYTAEGLLEVEPRWVDDGPFAGHAGGEVMPPEYYKSYVAAHVAAIKSDRVLTAALKALEGKQTLYTGPNASYRLAKDIQVRHVPETFNIAVSLKGSDKEQVYLIVREVLEKYIVRVEADRSQADADRRREMMSERDDLRKQLDELGRKLASLRTESNVLEGGPVEQTARLMELVRRLTEVQMILAEANAAWTLFQELKTPADAEKNISPILAAFPEITARIEADPVIVMLRQEVARGELEVERAKGTSDAKSEAVRKAEAALAATRKVLEKERGEVAGRLVAEHAVVLKSRYDSVRCVEAELQVRVAEARSAAVEAAQLNADYRVREGEFRRVQAGLDTVTDGMDRMRINSALSRPNIRVVRWPIIPIEPDNLPRPETGAPSGAPALRS